MEFEIRLHLRLQAIAVRVRSPDGDSFCPCPLDMRRRAPWLGAWQLSAIPSAPYKSVKVLRLQQAILVESEYCIKSLQERSNHVPDFILKFERHSKEMIVHGIEDTGNGSGEVI